MSRTYSSIWPKVVLHILWDGGFGGAQKFIRDIAVYSDKNKFQHVIVFLAVGGPLSKEISSRGVIVYVLGMRSGFSLIKGLRLFKIINKFKPDIIHNHFRNYIANLIILFFRGIPKVYIEHGGEWLEGESFKQIIFYNCFVRFYDLVLVNSNYVKGEIVRLTGVKPKRFETLYIGINAVEYSDASIDRNLLKKEFDIAVEDRVIGIVGRLIKRKGIDDFIKVASYINRIEKRCSYVVIGDGYCRKELEGLALALNVNCHFLGGRADVTKLLKIFDIFIFTSRSEAFGIVILEAMAAKVPVLGFSIPGANEIISNNNCGILLPERNHLRLAEAAVDILHNKEKYEALAEAGYKRVIDKFNIMESVRLLEDYYESVIESRNKNA